MCHELSLRAKQNRSLLDHDQFDLVVRLMNSALQVCFSGSYHVQVYCVFYSLMIGQASPKSFLLRKRPYNSAILLNFSLWRNFLDRSKKIILFAQDQVSLKTWAGLFKTRLS